MSKLNLIGKSFGKLKVIGFDFVRKKHKYWKCKCGCGNEKV